MRGIARNSYADPGAVIADVIHTVRSDFAKFLVGEIVGIDAFRLAFGAVIAATVFVIADQLLFLVSTEITLPGSLGANYLIVDMLKLSIAVAMV